MLDNCVSENDHILSLTLLLINILYIIYVFDSFAWMSLINVCMYNGSLPVGLGLISHVHLKVFESKGRCQKLLSGFFPLRGYPPPPPPPTPLTENHFAKKPLAERGVHPPPKRKIAENFPQKMGQKGLK